MGELAKLAGLRSSKRSNSQPTPSGTNPPAPGNLLPLIRVNRTETAPSSESGGEGSQIDEEEEEEEGEEMDEAMGMMGKGTEKTTKMGEQQSGIAQKNSLPSSGGGAAVVVSTVESRKKVQNGRVNSMKMPPFYADNPPPDCHCLLIRHPHSPQSPPPPPFGPFSKYFR